jgi:rhodanese-related sulfurtransferase
MREVKSALRDATIVLVACSGTALAVNAARSGGIPLVQKEPYQILVPCPEIVGEVVPVRPGDPALAQADVLLIDARAGAHYEKWHRAGAFSLPYDYLEPVSASALNQVAASGARRVIVYGDDAQPDCGEQLAKELAGKGIRNVGFLVGGAAALGATAPDARQP